MLTKKDRALFLYAKALDMVRKSLAPMMVYNVWWYTNIGAALAFLTRTNAEVRDMFTVLENDWVKLTRKFDRFVETYLDAITNGDKRAMNDATIAVSEASQELIRLARRDE